MQKSVEFAFGAKHEVMASKRIAAVQSISGTGGCKLAGELLKKFFSNSSIYLPDPTWGNHESIYRSCGLQPLPYRYYDRAARRLDFEGMQRDLEAAPDGSLFLLHACAHNPTGCDPSPAQWDALSQQMLAKRHVALFDNAYQVDATRARRTAQL